MVRSIYLIEERPSPTTDFFLSPETLKTGVPAQRCGFDKIPPAEALPDAELIFVRYLPGAWVRILSRPGLHPKRLVLFIDDDLLDPCAWGGLPWRYRCKLFWLTGRRLRWLQRQFRRKQAELWVGSTALQRKYARYQPRLIRPRPIPMPASPVPVSALSTSAMSASAVAASPAQPSPSPSPPPSSSSTKPLAAAINLFYHGSASHQREHVWIQRLMRELLAVEPRIKVEVIADRRIARGYRDQPRTQIIAPMDWRRYRRFLQQPGRHIGLAPLLPSAFNAARSYTKFFDITAAGAVGLYTEGSVYHEIVAHGQDGLLLPLDLERWMMEILDLATDPRRRAQLIANAMEKVNAQRKIGDLYRQSSLISGSMHSASP